METQIFQFNLLELLALAGLVQSVYSIVHMVGRSAKSKQIIIPILFFGTLSTLFILYAAQSRWAVSLPHYEEILWLGWALLLTFNALFLAQIINLNNLPNKVLWLLPLLPLKWLLINHFFIKVDLNKEVFLLIGPIIIGTLSILSIWIDRRNLGGLLKRKNGKERYWVIISLLFLNLGLMGCFLVKMTLENDFPVDLAQIILGLGFVYLASTSLFRIYPHPVEVKKSLKSDTVLVGDDLKIATRIETLLLQEKVYQEPGYNRSSLARELEVQESALSNIVGVYFEKTVPQLLNEYRVENSKSLLKETKADIADISYESGFNSVATFNRVFKEITGLSPSDYRKTRT